ncbi:hypothetical protein GCM10023066_11760 [Nocardioides kongjuensis]
MHRTGDALEPEPPLDLTEALQLARIYLVRHGVDPATAEDLAAEAVLRLWCRLQSGYRPECAAAYLMCIVRNLRCDHERQSAREWARFAQLSALAHCGDIPGANDDRSPEGVAEVLTLREARRRLPRRYQQVLFCLVELDMSYEQIVRHLGLPSRGAAAVLVHRARTALRAELGQ